MHIDADGNKTFSDGPLSKKEKCQPAVPNTCIPCPVSFVKDDDAEPAVCSECPVNQTSDGIGGPCYSCP